MGGRSNRKKHRPTVFFFKRVDVTLEESYVKFQTEATSALPQKTKLNK